MSPVERVVVYTDGGARGNPGPAAIGAVVIDATDAEAAGPGAVPLAEVSEAIGVATNNEAEYRAVIAGLSAARDAGARVLELRADSQLVIRQLEGTYRVRHPGLRPLFREAQRLLTAFDEVTLTHVPRENNIEADALVNQALDALVDDAPGAE